MKSALATVFATLFLLTSVPPLAAQPAAARVANPDTIEFQVSPVDQTTTTAYRIELFPAGSDASLAVPVKTLDIPASQADNGQPIRIDLRSARENVADGEYIATIRMIRADGTSPRSQPTAPFLISGHGVASQGSSAEPNLTDEERRQERFWTRVAIAVGAGLLLLPIVLR